MYILFSVIQMLKNIYLKKKKKNNNKNHSNFPQLVLPVLTRTPSVVNIIFVKVMKCFIDTGEIS
jgi:hypothetical protein